MRKNRKKVRGFSLAEVLLSVTILLFGMLPILKLMVGGTRISIGSRDTIIGSELAQEGVELIKNVKDNNIRLAAQLEPLSWLPASGSNWSDCRIDYNDSVVTNPGSGNRITCGQSSFDLTSSPLQHLGADGRFKRRLFIDYNLGNKTVTTISMVYWGPAADAPTSYATAKTQCDRWRICIARQSGDPTSACTNESPQCVYAETKLTPWE